MLKRCEDFWRGATKCEKGLKLVRILVVSKSPCGSFVERFFAWIEGSFSPSLGFFL